MADWKPLSLLGKVLKHHARSACSTKQRRPQKMPEMDCCRARGESAGGLRSTSPRAPVLRSAGARGICRAPALRASRRCEAPPRRPRARGRLVSATRRGRRRSRGAPRPRPRALIIPSLAARRSPPPAWRAAQKPRVLRAGPMRSASTTATTRRRSGRRPRASKRELAPSAATTLPPRPVAEEAGWTEALATVRDEAEATRPRRRRRRRRRRGAGSGRRRPRQARRARRRASPCAPWRRRCGASRASATRSRSSPCPSRASSTTLATAATARPRSESATAATATSPRRRTRRPGTGSWPGTRPPPRGPSRRSSRPRGPYGP